jgi:hypothetical protein
LLRRIREIHYAFFVHQETNLHILLPLIEESGDKTKTNEKGGDQPELDPSKWMSSGVRASNAPIQMRKEKHEYRNLRQIFIDKLLVLSLFESVSYGVPLRASSSHAVP